MSDERRYLVTGGTSGIGRAVAQHLTATGASVWITGTSERTLDAALADGVAAGGSVCDVSSPEAVEAAFADATTGDVRLDGVFVNAGIDGRGLPATQVDQAHFRRVLDVNVVGAFTTALAAHAHLRRPGSLVINASVNALRPERDFVDYNASKAAVASVAQSLALEWSAEGLAVIAVCPGYFPSRMTEPFLNDPATREQLLAHIPAGRFGEPDEIAGTVAFLLSPAAAFLTGALVPVAGASNV
ncbi:SDR family NAD(P)-dependent oxidoreductase [Patulibacter sp. S7RM1-6]